MRLAVSRVACLCSYRLFVVEVDLIRQETACVLNPAGWTLPVHTVPVSLSFRLTFIFPPAVWSLTLSLSHISTCCVSLLFLFHLCLYYSLLVDLKNLYCQFTSSSSVSLVSNAQAPLIIITAALTAVFIFVYIGVQIAGLAMMIAAVLVL